MNLSITASTLLDTSAPILISVGTRPEIIKMAPVYAALQHAGVPTAWVHTGQHRDMADGLYRFFGIEPEHVLHLDRHNSSLAHLNSLLLEGLSNLYEEVKPRVVLVHGDTTSTLASAMAAYYLDIPIGHVEAGLRTHQAREPFPEEKNREITARLARWHFAPTAGAVDNLQREGINHDAIFQVGNTAVDAALYGCTRLDEQEAKGQTAWLPPELEQLGRRLKKWRLVTVTAHRRENWGPGIEQIARSVSRLLSSHPDLAVVWPVHANPAVADAVRGVLATQENALDGRLILCPPLDYPALLWCLKHSQLVLTDSGGIQEEGAALSTPVLVLRDTTERPELIAAGAGLLVGTDEDHIVHTVSRLLADDAPLRAMRQAVNPFGDGLTSARVAAVLQHDLGL